MSSEIHAGADETVQTTPPIDDALVRRLHDGDRDALAAVYQRWGSLVHNVAMRSVGNHYDAEDITQQVFVSAWRSRGSLRPGSGSLPGWLVTITRRRCADLHDSRSREQRRHQAVSHRSTTATEVSGEDAIVDQLIVAHELRLLGDPRARILRLSVVEGHSHADIATMLDLPLGTVKSHARRGLLHLRARLEEVNP